MLPLYACNSRLCVCTPIGPTQATYTSQVTSYFTSLTHSLHSDNVQWGEEGPGYLYTHCACSPAHVEHAYNDITKLHNTVNIKMLNTPQCCNVIGHCLDSSKSHRILSGYLESSLLTWNPSADSLKFMIK